MCFSNAMMLIFLKIKIKNQCQGGLCDDDTVGCLTEIWVQDIIITIYTFCGICWRKILKGFISISKQFAFQKLKKKNLKISCLWLHNEEQALFTEKKKGDSVMHFECWKK